MNIWTYIFSLFWRLCLWFFSVDEMKSQHKSGYWTSFNTFKCTLTWLKHKQTKTLSNVFEKDSPVMQTWRVCRRPAGGRSSICKHPLSVTASLSPVSQSGGPAVNFDQPLPTERIEAGSPSVSTTGADYRQRHRQRRKIHNYRNIKWTYRVTLSTQMVKL